MAQSKYIQSLKNAVRGRELSMDWYRKKIREFGQPTSAQLVREGKRSDKPYIGKLNMFVYDPKLKDKLPYYDTFPLVIPVEPAKGGFRGLNLHYLPPVLRAKFLDSLLETTNNDKYDESTRFRLTYNLLKGAARYRYFRPCIKHYLLEHVKSRFAEVASPEWEIATFLPIARWQKQSANRVYYESRRIANG